MSDSKKQEHTPEPWTMEEDTNVKSDTAIAIRGAGDILATVWGDEGEDLANARLIIAAPTLKKVQLEEAIKLNGIGGQIARFIASHYPDEAPIRGGFSNEVYAELRSIAERVRESEMVLRAAVKQAEGP
jgi:hypothetical protein